MLALYSAVIAIVTGATSAWIGYYFNVRKDRLQWSRNHATRWDSARHEAYVAFAAAIKHEVRLHVKMAAALHPELWPGHETLSMSEGWPLLAAAEDARADLLESILLLADGPTVEAARDWQQKVWELRVLHNDTAVSAEVIRQALIRASDARDRFYACARPDLGIMTALPAPQLLQSPAISDVPDANTIGG
ncbi:hypothetical protein OH799_26035 [Nocardia sp. NBC_00881]|uniref:hypothetical protein n=1 Tax=Nocardia sp. NBC_00881 TaxID=2975995 RepID=UPI003870420E|nr:hypothetical protein OH799_26035 [Nocardia sp. NBC_00881]